MKNILRLIKLLWTYPARTAGGLLAVILSDAVQLSIPWLTKNVVDGLESHDLSRTDLMGWGALILLLALISYVAKQVWRHLILGAARRVESQLRARLLDKTLELTMERARSTDNGKFMALASNDVPAVGQALAFGVVAFFDSIFITVVAFALMYQLSPALTGYALIPFPCLAALMLVSLKFIYKRWDRAQQGLEDLTEKTRESLSGIRTLRAYVQGEGDQAAFSQKNLVYKDRMLDYVKIDAIFSPLILLFAGSSSAILLFFGGQLVLEGTLSLGTLAAFIGYLALLTWPMIAAGWMLVLLQRGAASIARLDKILEAESESVDADDLAAVEHLQIRNLSFAYPDGKEAIKDWTLDLPPGKMLGIVGPVGSGKSTFLKLLQRLENPPSESIYLDDKDVVNHSVDSARSAFSTVSQEPFLFSDTIRNNLLMAAPSASSEAMGNAVEVAALSADLREFPDGLETVLGERGISLSGGQRQRTALARALLKPAPILLLDDTLSAVDSLTESQILEHLRKRRETSHQSTIVVSHRLSTVREADEILVVVEGTIQDRGTHAQLLSRPGLYAELVAFQSNIERDRHA